MLGEFAGIASLVLGAMAFGFVIAVQLKNRLRK